MYGKRPVRMSRYVLENGGLNEDYELDARHGTARRLRCRTMGEWKVIWFSLTGDRAWMNIHFGHNGSAQP
jgi:hypothetical protein